MAIENFRQLAAYNNWANLRLYGAALELAEEAYRRPTGVFFGSLHGTLNHLLVADRVWLKRLTGTGEHPDRLDAILHDDRQDLLRARIAEDARIDDLVGSYTDADLTHSVDVSHQGRRTIRPAAPGYPAAFLQSSDPSPRPGARMRLDPHRPRAADARPAGVSTRRSRAEFRVRPHRSDGLAANSR